MTEPKTLAEAFAVPQFKDGYFMIAPPKEGYKVILHKDGRIEYIKEEDFIDDKALNT